MQAMKISSGQAVFLIIGTIFPTAMLTVPTIIVKYASTDAWLSLLLGTMIGIAMALVSSTLAMKHPGLTVFQITEKYIGRIAGKTVGLLFCFYFFITSIDVIHQFTDFMVQNVMTKTPTVVLAIIITLLALYAIYHGLEVISRANSIVLTGSFIVFIISTPFYFHQMKLSNLLPVFDTPLRSILMGTYSSLSWFSEVFVILLLTTFLTKPGKARTIAVFGISITGFSLIWVVTGSLAIFGAKMIPLFDFPSFNVFRIMEVARFLERIDAFYISVWVGMMFMKVSIIMWCCFYCFNQTLEIKRPMPFLLPLGLMTLTFSIVSWGGKVEYKSFLRNCTVFYLLVAIVVPTLLWLIVLWKGAKKKVAT